MSASLVGSEMCIRDRAVRGDHGLLRKWQEDPPAANNYQAPGYKSPLWTVSYTHLTLPTICSV
eukprot:7854550-Alexandrium_andersonii.AAC.1